VPTTNTAGDDASGDDTSCDFPLCAVMEHVVNHACVACAPGFGRDAGDSTGGADTNCTETYTIFVTSSTHTGALGGLAGADAICQGLAGGASLAGTYIALMSTSGVNAIDRIADAGFTIRRVDGLRVADNRADFFDDSSVNAPGLTESGGAPIPIFDGVVLSAVMTGSNSNGTYGGFSCGDWTNTFNAPLVGFSNETSGYFSVGGGRSCDLASTEHFYCIGR
jgi:hypothetical protein